MQVLKTRRYRHGLAAIAIAAGMTLAGVAVALPAVAATPNITGVVEDTSSNVLSGVTVNVLDPATASTVTSMTTGSDGTFNFTVASGTWNLQFIPSSSTGLQSYLATGVSTDSVPLTVILKSSTVVQVQGSLSDSQGNVYGASVSGRVLFRSPLNSGTWSWADGGGNYSLALFADQNFTVDATANPLNGQAFLYYSGLPVGTLDHGQTYNVTMPTVQLTVSVRDASGNPITAGVFKTDGGSVSPLPGIPGSYATATAYAARLDASGNVTLPEPPGITPINPRIQLNNGLIIPFTLHPITGDRHAYIIFDQATGTVIVDDQPPVVGGSPDRVPDHNGWYNAPVTFTWTSVDPAPSSGLPTIPPPVTLTTEGANQTVTSAKSCDPAGNCATGSLTGINLDMTPPSVAVTGVIQGASYTGGVVPTPACGTVDSLSGVATNAVLSVTNSGINYTATCAGATDNAGNAAAPVSMSYQVIPVGWTTASLNDSKGNPISGAAVVFRSSGGTVTNATTGTDGTAGVALTPGNYSVTMYYATGYQTKTISVTANGPNAVSFSTVAVTVQINDPTTSDLASASVTHAGNTGSFGPKAAVDGTGQVTFQVLPGTNSFTAWVASGYQTQTMTVTGPMTITFATVAVSVQINDPNTADFASALVSHAGNTGAFGPKTAVDSTGQVTFQVLPGTNSFTAWVANGYQTQAVTVTGPATVTFSTVAVTVTVLKNGTPLTTATVAHAGNTGAFGPKTAVDGNGQVTFQVLTGTSYFTAWDGSAYQTQTLTVTAAAATSITVP